MNKALTLYPSAPKAIAILIKLEGEIERGATSFKELNRIAAEAEKIQRLARVELTRDQSQVINAKGGSVRVKVEKQLARWLDEGPKAKGDRGRGRPKLGGPKREPPKSDAPTLAEMKVTKKRSAAASKLLAMPDERVDEIITELAERDKPISPSTVLAAERKRMKTQKKHAVAAAVFSADGPFGTAIIDPPWKTEKIDRDIRPNQDAFDYPTMTVDEIVGFFKADLIPKLESDCHLFLWTTHKWLPSAIKMLDEIGFKYVLTMVWHKAGGFQPVDMPQYNCEFVIYGRRGSPVFIDTRDFPCCFDGERREHSRKPERFYEIVGRVTGGSRIDVFSREARAGFAQYGNESGKFSEAAE